MAAPSQIGNKEVTTLGPKDLHAKQRMKCLAQHEPTLQAISEHPQAGMINRFTEEWAFGLAYLEGEVVQRFREAKQFCRSGRVGQAVSESTLSEIFDEKMMSLLKYLKLHAESFQLASEMSQRPTPTSLSADFHRTYLSSYGMVDGVSKAPNGEESSEYGEVGEPLPDKYTPLFPEALDPIEWLLVNKMMNPFIRFFCRPFRKVAKKVKGENDPTFKVDIEVVDFAIISMIARVVVFGLAVVFLAAAIGALNSINGPNLRIVLMSVIALMFAVWVNFLGPDSVQVYLIIVAFFQVMVIFVGTASI